MHKHLLLEICLLCLVAVSCGTTKSISYLYKPFTAEGCGVEYTTAYFDGLYKIVVRVESDRLVFSDNPEMLLRLDDDTVITLKGESVNTSEHSGGVIVNNVVIPTTSLNTVALFPIQEETLIQLKNGVSKIRISTIPLKHERTFNKDIIGKTLYKQYLQMKKEESF